MFRVGLRILDNELVQIAEVDMRLVDAAVHVAEFFPSIFSWIQRDEESRRTKDPISERINMQNLDCVSITYVIIF